MKRGTTTTAMIAIAVLAGFLVLLLTFPASGIDPIPPQCFSIFSYNVPCDDRVAPAAGAATAAVVGLALWLRDRRK